MVAVAIGGAALIGGVASVVSGNKAASAQENAANQASAAQDRASEVNRYIYDTTRSDYAPWRTVGQGALYKLSDMYGVPRPTGSTGTTGAAGTTGAMTPGYSGFETSPGYQFRVDEATKALERSASATGSLRSGATADAIQRRVQGVASGEYENYAAHLAQLAGIGQTAVAGGAQAGQSYAAGEQGIAANQGNLAIAAGNARASGYVNTGNAINGTVQNLASAYLYNRGYNSTPSSGWGTPGVY